MIFTETPLKSAYIIELEQIEDERGFFARSWCAREFAELGLNPNLVQCNVSFNKKKGTLRGMHYQASPHEEAKMVRCTKGSLYDVIVDLRKDSPTFKQWFSVDLTAENRKQLYIPEGFAHGFLTLEDGTEIFYHMTEFYHPESAKRIRWNDSAFQIKWPISDWIISEQDRGYPDFRG